MSTNNNVKMPDLTRDELEKLISDWSTIARSTLDCTICDNFYETPFEWLDKKERGIFVDHLYKVHVHPTKMKSNGSNKRKRKNPSNNNRRRRKTLRR